MFSWLHFCLFISLVRFCRCLKVCVDGLLRVINYFSRYAQHWNRTTVTRTTLGVAMRPSLSWRPWRTCAHLPTLRTLRPAGQDFREGPTISRANHFRRQGNHQRLLFHDWVGQEHESQGSPELAVCHSKNVSDSIKSLVASIRWATWRRIYSIGAYRWKHWVWYICVMLYVDCDDKVQMFT